MDDHFPAGFGAELEKAYQKLARERRPQIVQQAEAPSRVPEDEIRKALKAAARDQAAVRKAQRS